MNKKIGLSKLDIKIEALENQAGLRRCRNCGNWNQHEDTLIEGTCLKISEFNKVDKSDDLAHCSIPDSYLYTKRSFHCQLWQKEIEEPKVFNCYECNGKGYVKRDVEKFSCPVCGGLKKVSIGHPPKVFVVPDNGLPELPKE